MDLGGTCADPKEQHGSEGQGKVQLQQRLRGICGVPPGQGQSHACECAGCDHSLAQGCCPLNTCTCTSNAMTILMRWQ